MKNQENVSKEYYLEGYIYLALSSQKSIALFCMYDAINL